VLNVALHVDTQLFIISLHRLGMC